MRRTLSKISQGTEWHCAATPRVTSVKQRVLIQKDLESSTSTSTICGDACPLHAPVLRPTSWPNARDRRDGKLINAALLSLMRRV